LRIPKKPTTEGMLAPQIGYLTMSPDQGAHTTFPIFAEPIPEFPGACCAQDSRFVDCPVGIVAWGSLFPGPAGDRAGPHLAFLVDISNEGHTMASFDVSSPGNSRRLLRQGRAVWDSFGRRIILSALLREDCNFSWFNAGLAFSIFAILCGAGGRLFHSCAEQEHHGVCPEDGSAIRPAIPRLLLPAKR